MNKELFTIGQISQICGISITTLRYYDKVGVLKPVHIDKETKYRYYDEDTIFFVVVLRYYQKLGFSLDKIPELLERKDLSELADILRDKSKFLEQKIHTMYMQQTSLLAWAELIQESILVQNGKNPIKLSEIKEEHLLYCHPKVYIFSQFKHFLANADLGMMTAKENQISYGPLYATFPSSEERIKNNFEGICLYIHRHPLNPPTEKTKAIGGYQAITTYHLGSLKTIEETYKKMKEWADIHRFVLRGDAMERYVVDNWSTIHEEHFITEIYLPLEQ